MSEVAADYAGSSGYKNLEPRALVGLISNWFERVAEVIPPTEYTTMFAGETKTLYPLQGLGEICLEYNGSRYLPRRDDEPNRPLQACTYRLSMREESSGLPEADPPEPLSWWMPLHMEYGPKLVLDTHATVEELVGSTKEQRERLERLLGGLQTAFVAAANERSKV